MSPVPEPVEIPYGDAPQQFAVLTLPEGDGPFPVIAFIHGGFWRNPYDLSYAEAQAADAAANGFAAWNIEYRRVGDDGGGYPGTCEDVVAAIDALAQVDAPLDLSCVAVVGHSAGGHLALWLGQQEGLAVQPMLVVGQAPVVDFTASAELSDGAVAEFLGGSPDQVSERYAATDPTRLGPARTPQLIVHGGADDIVPVAHAARYLDLAGDRVVFCEFPGVDHFDVIDAGSETWQFVLDVIRERQQ